MRSNIANGRGCVDRAFNLTNRLDRAALSGVQFFIRCPVVPRYPVGLGAEFGLGELSIYGKSVLVWVGAVDLAAQ